MFFRSGGLFALAALFVLTVATFASWSAGSTAKQFADHGIKTPATIDKRWTKVTRDSDGDKRTSYYVQLNYDVGSQNYVVHEQINSKTYKATRVKQTVPILYLPSTPIKIEYPIGNNAKTSRWLQILALAAGVGWLVMIWLFGRWAVFATLARRKGRQLYATILDIEKTNVRVNKQSCYRLVWTDELRRSGKSYMAKQAAFDDYEIGDEIIVFEHQGKVFWRGDIGDRAPRLSPIPRVKRR